MEFISKQSIEQLLSKYVVENKSLLKWHVGENSKLNAILFIFRNASDCLLFYGRSMKDKDAVCGGSGDMFSALANHVESGDESYWNDFNISELSVRLNPSTGAYWTLFFIK